MFVYLQTCRFQFVSLYQAAEKVALAHTNDIIRIHENEHENEMLTSIHVQPIFDHELVF